MTLRRNDGQALEITLHAGLNHAFVATMCMGDILILMIH